VKIELGNALDDLLVPARSGSLDTHFDREWELKAPQILRLME
jgi:hypothetical protein